MMQAAAEDMELRALFPDLMPAPPALDVCGIATHSAEVVRGGLFIACAGTREHGLRYLDDALRREPGAVAWDPAGVARGPVLPAGVCGLPVPGLGARLGDIAARFYADPSAEIAVTGITGTNGKTTVAWLLAGALDRLAGRAAYMGTLGYGLVGRTSAADLTTPGCITLHRRLRELADCGARHVALEVSSHALDQHRIDGVRFRVVAFTNLSRDHLDYHGDMAGYARAKERLFLGCGAGSAVINVGDEFGRALAARLPPAMRAITVAAAPPDASPPPAALTARCLEADALGQRIALSYGTESQSFSTPLVGAFNVENLAVTAGVLLAEGHALARIAAALARCTAPPGRMEVVPGRNGPRVIVDFAHTPQALERALVTLRAQAPRQLWCVFGCGGDRDPGKRRAMGEIARARADRVIVTDDNPRQEDPRAIVEAILAGTGPGPAVEVIHDRAAAIRRAILGADAADLVLIAGKGHETGQIIGGETRPFSDRAVAAAVLGELA